jgi:hypothetical protein
MQLSVCLSICFAVPEQLPGARSGMVLGVAVPGPLLGRAVVWLMQDCATVN